MKPTAAHASRAISRPSSSTGLQRPDFGIGSLGVGELAGFRTDREGGAEGEISIEISIHLGGENQMVEKR